MHSTTLTKSWAICALVTAVVAGIIPRTAYDTAFGGTALGPYLSAAVALIVGGFYFVMLWHCLRGRGISRRWPWVMLFVLLPVISAFIYYFGAYAKIEKASAM